MAARAPSALGDGFAGTLVGAVAGVGIAMCAALLTDPGAAIARWPGWAAVALAAGTAGLLEDPARHATAASPTPLPLRRAVRLAAGLPIVLVAWIAVLALATTGVGAPYVPAARLGLTLQAAALITVTLAAGAAFLRHGLGEARDACGHARPARRDFGGHHAARRRGPARAPVRPVVERRVGPLGRPACRGRARARLDQPQRVTARREGIAPRHPTDLAAEAVTQMTRSGGDPMPEPSPPSGRDSGALDLVRAT